MMNEKERQKAIENKTNQITDDLCHLKDLCLADSKKIDKSITFIIENLSCEMQEGFKRYYRELLANTDML